MAYIVADRISETGTVEGTGDLSLAGPVLGFRRFSDALSDGDTCIINIRHDAEPGEWEVVLATYVSATDTMERTTVLVSSEGTDLVPFSPGLKVVSLGPSAVDIATLRGGGDFLVTPTIGGDPVARVADITKDQVGLPAVENFPPASQAQAEAGAEPAAVMTPLRTAQAIAALGADASLLVPRSRIISTTAPVSGGGNLDGDRNISVSLASLAQAEAGVASNVLMTPERTAQAIAALSPPSPQAFPFIPGLEGEGWEFVDDVTKTEDGSTAISWSLPFTTKAVLLQFNVKRGFSSGTFVVDAASATTTGRAYKFGNSTSFQQSGWSSNAANIATDSNTTHYICGYALFIKPPAASIKCHFDICRQTGTTTTDYERIIGAFSETTTLDLNNVRVAGSMSKDVGSRFIVYRVP